MWWCRICINLQDYFVFTSADHSNGCCFEGSLMVSIALALGMVLRPVEVNKVSCFVPCRAGLLISLWCSIITLQARALVASAKRKKNSGFYSLKITNSKGNVRHDKCYLLLVIQEDRVINLAWVLWRWAPPPCFKPLSAELNAGWWIAQELAGRYRIQWKEHLFDLSPSALIPRDSSSTTVGHLCPLDLPGDTGHIFWSSHKYTQHFKVKVNMSLCTEGVGGCTEKWKNWKGQIERFLNPLDLSHVSI